MDVPKKNRPILKTKTERTHIPMFLTLPQLITWKSTKTQQNVPIVVVFVCHRGFFLCKTGWDRSIPFFSCHLKVLVVDLCHLHLTPSFDGGPGGGRFLGAWNGPLANNTRQRHTNFFSSSSSSPKKKPPTFPPKKKTNTQPSSLTASFPLKNGGTNGHLLCHRHGATARRIGLPGFRGWVCDFGISRFGSVWRKMDATWCNSYHIIWYTVYIYIYVQ